MKIIRILLILMAMVLVLPALQAQDFLQKAKNYLDAGDCDNAQRAYDAYKVEHPKGDAEVKRRIDECKEIEKSVDGVRFYNANGVSFKMMPVQGGSFRMGCEDNNCKPIHFVTVSGFWMGETEVTQGLWEAVMGSTIRDQLNKMECNCSLFGEGVNYPMYLVSHNEAEIFCRKLNQLLSDQLPKGYQFVLPTEAEWEFAARGGNKSLGYKYSGSDNIEDVAWYGVNNFNDDVTFVGGNNDGRVHPVKQLKCNELGLYDMSGNVLECCSDYYQDDYYENSPAMNPHCDIPDQESHRVLRGGEWAVHSWYHQVTVRYSSTPDAKSGFSGFRIALAHRK